MANTRVFLVLGRVSNLSTVWANCLCAWVLAGMGPSGVFASLLVGTSLLYVGGMYLNDYCDIDFDKSFRPERPIPSGQISRRTVLFITLTLLGMGYLLVAWTSQTAALFGLLLLGLIVVYNLVHKKTALGVPLMAGCRLAVYLVVGAAAIGGLRSEVVWAGMLMYLFVFGITSLARSESTNGSVPKAGLVALLLPLVGVLYLGWNSGYGVTASVGVAMCGAWIGYAFWNAGRSGQMIVGKAIGPLLAGICLLDGSIIASMRQITVTTSLTLLAFFVIALVAQRRIPAT